MAEGEGEFDVVMGQDFNDIVNVLWSQIMGCLEVDDRHQCETFLRSACQKHLFAERRLTSLKKRIGWYRRKRSVEGVYDYPVIVYPDRLPIEMDFDHCVLSLRSSLEHLAQLINAIIPLNLSPKVTKGQTHVTIKNVIDEIFKKDLLRNDECLSDLSSYLKTEIEKDWYTELHDLRIESFHVKSGRLTRTETQTLDRQLLDLRFLLPDSTVSSAKTETDRDITYYCKSRVEDVEMVLNTSFHYLSNYLSRKYGDEWLEAWSDE